MELDFFHAVLQSDMDLPPMVRATVVDLHLRHVMSEKVRTGNLEDLGEFLQQNPSLGPKAAWEAAFFNQFYVMQYLLVELGVRPKPSALKVALEKKNLRSVALLTFMGVPLPENPTRRCRGVFPPLA
jgi:hypothetical protein